MGREALKS
jgi:nucleotide-binding universal stress UspA family protein